MQFPRSRFHWNSGSRNLPSFKETIDMATFTESEIRGFAQSRAGYQTVTAKLNEEVSLQSATSSFDVFLSHSTKDAEIVLGVKAVLVGQNKSVYVDWIEDRGLDRTNVTPSTAATLRRRMEQCKSLLYVHTENSGGSKWMPWELGYFDGHNGAVAIFPVTKVRQDEFKGQEYLGLYPYVDKSLASPYASSPVRVRKKTGEFRDWNAWSASPRSFRVTA